MLDQNIQHDCFQKNLYMMDRSIKSYLGVSVGVSLSNTVMEGLDEFKY